MNTGDHEISDRNVPGQHVPDQQVVDREWRELSNRASVASHRLVGWIYWDPTAIADYTALGVEEGRGYYVASRAAPLGDAGNDVVAATFYSINPVFIGMALDLCRAATTFEATAAARDDAVVRGLREYAPEICDELSGFDDELWAAVDALPSSGRVLFAAHRQWPRPDDPLLSAWLAVNCLREWRGDTHWALHAADDIDGAMAGILDNAWRSYEPDWIPRSRGTDDAALAAAYGRLAERGWAVDGEVTVDAIEYRQRLEDRLDDITAQCWRLVGAPRTTEFVELVDRVGDRMMERIDVTAGTNWMPAGRERPRR